MWEIALQVFGITFAVLWMIQESIDIIENIPLRHFGAIFRLELGKCPIGDILASVAAIFMVNIVGETLYTCIPAYTVFEIHNSASYMKRLMVCPYTSSANN